MQEEGVGTADSKELGQGGMSFPCTSAPHERELGSSHHASTTISSAVRGDRANLRGPQ